jgi:hypothetical protein
VPEPAQRRQVGGRVEAAPVVAYQQPQRVRHQRDPYLDPGRARVLRDVAQRFMQDPGQLVPYGDRRLDPGDGDVDGDPLGPAPLAAELLHRLGEVPVGRVQAQPFQQFAGLPRGCGRALAHRRGELLGQRGVPA